MSPKKFFKNIMACIRLTYSQNPIFKLTSHIQNFTQKRIPQNTTFNKMCH